MIEMIPETTRQTILRDAERIVSADRNEQYGEPEDNFANIAKYWSVYLGQEIDAVDVGMMMCLFKVARITGSGYQSRDSFVDLCGYAACAAGCVADA